MRSKGERPTNDELLAQLDDLGVEDKTGDEGPASPALQQQQQQQQQEQSAPPPNQHPENDPLAELSDLASQRPRSTDSKSPSKTSKATPSSSSEQRRSEEETEHAPHQQETAAAASSGGGWFGGLFATASAAVKQAESAVKEIQNNEEAQKWAQHVKGNVGALRDLG